MTPTRAACKEIREEGALGPFPGRLPSPAVVEEWKRLSEQAMEIVRHCSLVDTRGQEWPSRTLKL